MNSEIDPIGIVAGGGGVVEELIASLKARAIPHNVAAIKGEASENLTDETVRWFSWGEIGRIIKFFKTNNCQKLVLIGSIKARPDFKSILGDPGTLMRVPKIVAALGSGGDDSVLRKVIDIIEAEGFKVVGLPDVASDLLIGEGEISSKKISESQIADLEKAKLVLRDLSKHDIGQGLVIMNGRVVAVEAAEGTDAMLQRVREIRKEKRISARISGGIFVKASKHGQDMRVDLPTIGAETIKRAKEAGLSGVVVEAGKVILLERDKVKALTDEYGMFLTGEAGF